MKYRVGQPVWAIGHCSGKWVPATIVGRYDYPICQCVICKQRTADSVIYEIVYCDGSKPNNEKFPNWASTEMLTRPRDPDQFTPAEDDFKLSFSPEHAKGAVENG